jgi:DNA-binding NtrC family response regulator
MPATLIASELFGHERGAFTGADQRRTGAFERADGGTIFLDEIGELPLEVQPALLGVLERRRFRTLGGGKETAVDVRVVSATHRDLRAGVNQSTFRADLYFRLAVARIVLPPLRERPEDIEPLVRQFVLELTGDPSVTPFGEAALERLQGQRWTGNVRELRNVVESALAFGTLEQDLGVAAEGPIHGETDPLEPYRSARAAVIARFEADYLGRLIQLTAGNASEAARRACMDRPYLLTLLRKHGLR